MKVGVVGASGYTGGEVVRLLSVHPEVELSWVTSRKHIGKPLSSIHPNMRNFSELRFVDFNTDMAGEVDAIFLCLPHHASMEIVDDIYGKTKILDLSADFRVSDLELYERYYGKHKHPELLKKAVYGLPELHRDEIKKADLVACPGCIATSVILPLNPLAKTLGNIRGVIDVKIGSSAAGRSAELGSNHPERTAIVRAYAPTDHRHLAEIQQQTGVNGFGISAHAVDMVRGILSTIHIFPENLPTENDLRKIYREAYGDEPFIRIVAKRNPPYNLPDAKTVVYSNFCEIGFAIDERNKRLVVFSAIDNMIKGAAGQAIQNLNLMFDLDETTGLKFPGFYV